MLDVQEREVVVDAPAEAVAEVVAVSVWAEAVASLRPKPSRLPSQPLLRQALETTPRTRRA